MIKKIYLARQEGTDLYKIGITKNDPKKRLKQLQTGNAGKFELVESFETKHDYKMETALHAHYQMRLVSGEWYVLSNEEVAKFISVCEDKEATMDFLKKNNNFWGANSDLI